MAEVVSSLFGITPESLQMQRDAAMEQQAVNYAKLDPFQRATANIYSGANRLGGAFGSMLGGQDPELARVAQRQALLKQAQPSDAKGWQALASQLWQSGDTQGAQEALARSQALEKAAAELQYKTAQTLSSTASADASTASAAKSRFDVSTAGQAQELLKTGKYTPESVLSFLSGEGGGPLVPIDKFTKPSADFIAKAVQLGFGDKATYGGYTSEQAAKVNDALFAEELKKKATGAPKTYVDATTKGETEFSKKLGELDAKKVADAYTVRDTAISSLKSLNKLAELPSQQLISGQFASGRVGATNLLATLGLASPSDVQKLSSSQQYQKVAGDVILQTLGGKLGSGFSNADRDFIASLVPQLETNPNARRELIKFMQGKNQDIIQEANNLETYARKNKGLSGYTPTIPLITSPSTGSNSISSMSNEQIAARIRELEANQRP